MTATPERLLLLQPRWLGDVLLCTPAIREARRAFPEARIDFATEAAGAEVLRRNPHLDEVLLDRRTPRSRIQLLREVARRRYDAVIDFRSTGSTAQLTLASRAAARIGLRGRGPRNLAYTHLLDRLTPPTYAARHKLGLLAPLGVPVQEIHDLRLEFPIGEEARDYGAELWRAHGLEGEVVVAITPVSRESYKQWGPDRWAVVGDAIAAEGARVLVTHGPGEREQALSMVEAMRSPAIWDFGPTGIEDLGAILERCALWIGNDGGTKHVAAAVGTSTLAVSRWQIGPVWTDATAPTTHAFIDRAPPQGCDLRCPRCVHRGCLTALDADSVLARVRVALTALRG